MTPNLRETITKERLPKSSVFFGVCQDGGPLLQNTETIDQIGPLLITGDPGSGKTKQLQVVAEGIEIQHDKNPNIRYSIITHNPWDWSPDFSHTHNDGMVDSTDPSVSTYLDSLVTWAKSSHAYHGTICLLIDGLSNLLHEKTVRNLRWLLMDGPSNHIWPIVTANPSTFRDHSMSLSLFRARQFARVQNPQDIDLVTRGINGGDPFAPLDILVPNVWYAFKENNEYLNYWLPENT